jgi:hypothetical protein
MMKRKIVGALRARVAITAVLFAFASAAVVSADGSAYGASGLTIAPGATARELGFAWFTSSPAKPVVQVALKADQKGDAFPVVRAKTFVGTSGMVTATAFNADDKTVSVGFYADRVTVTGLTASAEYVYRVGDGTRWTVPTAIATRDPEHFGFLVVGDPQLGSKAAGAKTLEADTAGWAATIDKATTAFPGASFLVSLGDQVNDYVSLSNQVAEYEAFFSPVQLRSLPMATVDGNHDFAMGDFYGAHYNQPHLSAKYGSVYGNDGDYWFLYGNVLFMMLNSNSENVAAHDLFIRDTVAQNPGATWRVACFHHSIYSEADHPMDPDILDRRATYAPVFERYGIDVVLQGHDHAYTRTFPMAKGKPVDGVDPRAVSVTDPAGIVYFTLDSASGSKFYDWKNPSPEAYSAARWQGKVPSFSYITVDGKSFSVATFRADDMSLIDSYSIAKTR